MSVKCERNVPACLLHCYIRCQRASHRGQGRCQKKPDCCASSMRARSRQIPLPESCAHSFVASGQPMAASRGSSATACLHQNCDGIGYDMGASGLRSFSIENLAVK